MYYFKQKKKKIEKRKERYLNIYLFIYLPSTDIRMYVYIQISACIHDLLVYIMGLKYKSRCPMHLDGTEKSFFFVMITQDIFILIITYIGLSQL